MKNLPLITTTKTRRNYSIDIYEERKYVFLQGEFIYICVKLKK